MNSKTAYKKISNREILCVILGAIISSVVLFLLHIFLYSKAVTGNHIFTNPALNYTDLKESIMTNKTLNLSKQINNYEKYKQQQGDITHLSVYYRNLNNGGWFGVNEQEEFSPASLMKLPILISYMKKSESEKGLLEQKITYRKNPNIPSYTQNIPPEYQLKEGEEYKLRDVLKYMMIYSDNHASSLLELNLPTADLQKTFTDIGLFFPSMKDGSFDNNVKVIDYASFFRILFNSSYLNRDNSEKVLNLLSQIQFKDGINRGVPEDTIVSHKFGERGIIGSNGKEEKQLHDCGIVYYPNHPYIVCLMTRGYDRNKLKSVLGDLSNIIYSETKNQYGSDPIDDDQPNDQNNN